MGERNIVLRDYDPTWPRLFEELRDRLLDVLGGLAVAIEHVGSTAVPGLTAKPVVDVEAVVSSAESVPVAIKRLEKAGWRHEEDLGIADREAFWPPADAPWHHLYLLPAGAEELRRHLAFRDYLRAHPETARTYAALKRDAARRFGEDRQAYSNAKSEFVEHILSIAIDDR